MGAVNEQYFIDVLRRYLPRRYGVDQGIVIDSNGKTSDQIDIIIYDPQYTPRLLDQQSHRYVLSEAVYAVIEVKPAINKFYLNYAANKAQSVRCLARTSVKIPYADGQYPAKALFPILAGIVGVRAEWDEKLRAPAFEKALGELEGNQTISIGLALEDRAFTLDYGIFDLDLTHGGLYFSDAKGSLAWFLFTLLKRLQDLGTVPAVNWEAYRDVLGTA